MSRMDRGRAFVSGIPEDGCAIIVARNDIGRWLCEGIIELRGKAVADRCRFFAIQHQSDCDKLAGLNGPVIIHESFANGHIRQEAKDAVDRSFRIRLSR